MPVTSTLTAATYIYIDTGLNLTLQNWAGGQPVTSNNYVKLTASTGFSTIGATDLVSAVVCQYGRSDGKSNLGEYEYNYINK